jgi:hypothetical protein
MHNTNEDNQTPCKNYELCGHIVTPINESYCMGCGSWFKLGFGWDTLTFIDCNEECDICYDHCTRKLNFPTNCGHAFCIKCSKDILFWDETKSHLSPVPYGCLPCPNGCNNPIKGVQCYCEGYGLIVKLWKETNPLEYIIWNNNESLSIETGDPNSSYGTSKCPMCRKKYERC